MARTDRVLARNAVRLVPWSTITNLRAVPMTWLEVPWYPRRFEVDLANGDVLEFVGPRDADEIVRAMRAA